jgi:hypothetical protein
MLIFHRVAIASFLAAWQSDAASVNLSYALLWTMSTGVTGSRLIAQWLSDAALGSTTCEHDCEYASFGLLMMYFPLFHYTLAKLGKDLGLSFFFNFTCF